ncbi:ABC transporter ATP-binding protein [Streptomyces sp. NPDC048301]|uniref:ABC transporter ATP-binding protein n=1 Tax=Streptomyces sp. NPDC048301 TaxID=3155631 RepID=UPI00341DE7AB
MTGTTQIRGIGPAVVFTGVHKSYGRAGKTVRAVDGIDLVVERGETVALLGRNGAGKSTAISLLLGLDTPDSGTVRLLGQDPERAVRAGLAGAMLQDGRPIPRVTARELVRFVAALHPRPLPVPETLALAGVTAYADRRIDKLSGGQMQRVRFAVALAGDPELIVLDEPTSALDVEARRALWDSVGRFAERGGTVVFSTHQLEEADRYADRIVVLDRGRVVADGSAEVIGRSVGGGLVSLDPGGRSAAELGSLPGVVRAEMRGGRAHLRSDDPDATVVALAALGAVRDLRVGRATLEDAFLSLTAPPDTTADAAVAAVTRTGQETV